TCCWTSPALWSPTGSTGATGGSIDCWPLEETCSVQRAPSQYRSWCRPMGSANQPAGVFWVSVMAGHRTRRRNTDPSNGPSAGHAALHDPAPEPFVVSVGVLLAGVRPPALVPGIGRSQQGAGQDDQVLELPPGPAGLQAAGGGRHRPADPLGAGEGALAAQHARTDRHGPLELVAQLGRARPLDGAREVGGVVGPDARTE